MLRKLIALLLASVLLLTASVSLAENAAGAAESSLEEVREKTGLTLLPPYGAEDMAYALSEDGTATLRFQLDGCGWTLCAAAEEENANLSGVEYETDVDEPLDVSGCEGFVGRRPQTGLRACWYDVENKTAYSLLCDGADYDIEQFILYASCMYLYNVKGAIIMLDAYLTSGYAWQPIACDPNLYSISAGVDIAPANGMPGASGVTVFAVAALTEEGEATAAFACLPLFAVADGGEDVVEYALTTTKEGYVLTREVKSVLRVGTNAEYAPFEYRDENGELTGYDIELLALLMSYMGREYEIVELPFENLIDSLGESTDMVVSALTISEERQEKALFSEPYFDQSLVFVAPVDGAETARDLAGKKVGVETGSTGEFYVLSMLDNVEAVSFSRLADAVAALAAGELDALVAENMPAEYYADQYENLHVMDDVLMVDEFGIAVASWDETLQSDINSALDALRDSGEYAALYEKWFE